jgi:hypothetical protein
LEGLEDKENITPNEIMNNQPDGDGGEPYYCFCQQVSFGEMVECDSGEVRGQKYIL